MNKPAIRFAENPLRKLSDTLPAKWPWLLSPSLPALALVPMLLAAHSGVSWYLLTVPALISIVGPLLDIALGENPSNPTPEQAPALEQDAYYQWVAYAYIPAQWAVILLGTWLFASGMLDALGQVLLVVSVGIVNGIAINTAHELGHKKTARDRWLAKLTLAPVAYGHFLIEHNYGHHRHVATPEDPVSARFGESFYSFWWRSVWGGLRSAWNIESARLGRRNQPLFSRHNELLQAWAMTGILFLVLTAWWGGGALLFLIAQAVIGFSLLEIVNYLEHYGLLRQKNPDGSYEPCAPRHSWNSNYVLSNLFLYNLQRHSDHHAHPARPYQSLRHFEESPQLPLGYGTMTVIALVPWFWFRIMDPLVLRHYDGDPLRTNLDDARRAKTKIAPAIDEK